MLQNGHAFLLTTTAAFSLYFFFHHNCRLRNKGPRWLKTAKSGRESKMSLQRWEGSCDKWVGLKEPAPNNAPIRHSRNATNRSMRTSCKEGLTVTWAWGLGGRLSEGLSG